MINQMMINPKNTAVKMIPYMWKDWKRNISWIRYQDTASDFTITMPKNRPQRMNFKPFIVKKLVEG